MPFPKAPSAAPHTPIFPKSEKRAEKSPFKAPPRTLLNLEKIPPTFFVASSADFATSLVSSFVFLAPLAASS